MSATLKSDDLLIGGASIKPKFTSVTFEPKNYTWNTSSSVQGLKYIHNMHLSTLLPDISATKIISMSVIDYDACNPLNFDIGSANTDLYFRTSEDVTKNGSITLGIIYV